MENKLVTLAIRTYHRAQMIKTVLEEEGIETLIHNLNIENPEMAVGVRIRIKESDLPRALKIVEEVENAWEKEDKKEEETGKEILIPVDFSDLSANAIDFGFYYAEKTNAKVVLMYVYFRPVYTISSGNRDVDVYSLSDSELIRRLFSQANADKENMTNLINKRINDKELPNVPFRFELREGVPEDEILNYCRHHKPSLVVMGSKGKKLSEDIVGSVAGEVLESCVSPVLAIPAKSGLNSAGKIRRIAFLTNFEQKDLIAIDSAIELFSQKGLEIFFIHASEKKETWDEILLAGIKNYFETHYPDLMTHYGIINAPNSIEIIDNYLEENNIQLLAFNARRRNLFSRLFNPGLAYKMILNSETPLFVTHV